ncbi:MAG: membrane protein insertase YidC [Candidatus Pacebacteria bacterium]|nr:membrane protein insertase YidC [Candidatus Paceibacterota bacterium]
MFDTFFYNPIYNLVILLSNYIVDAGIVVIITTIIIKFLLFPFYKKQIHNQIAMKKAKPELDNVKEKYKNKNLSKEEKQAIAMETMGLYKKYGIRPFSMILLLILQIPILFALYWVFYKGGLPEIDSEVLYSFVSEPKEIVMNFLGLFPLKESSIFLAALAGITQFLHFSISMPDVKFSDIKKKGGKMSEDFANSMQVNLKFGLPIFIFFILATALNSAVALYWITSNVFMTTQEYFMRNKKAEIKELDKNNK